MSIDYSQSAHPKPTRKKTKDWQARDRAESEKVRTRSHGWCEVRAWKDSLLRENSEIDVRCYMKAAHVHHIYGGNGRRGRGDSALAENKLHVCLKCHEAIHARRLVIEGEPGSWRFRRV